MPEVPFACAWFIQGTYGMERCIPSDINDQFIFSWKDKGAGYLMSIEMIGYCQGSILHYGTCIILNSTKCKIKTPFHCFKRVTKFWKSVSKCHSIFSTFEMLEIMLVICTIWMLCLLDKAYCVSCKFVYTNVGIWDTSSCVLTRSWYWSCPSCTLVLVLGIGEQDVFTIGSPCDVRVDIEEEVV